MRSLKNNNFYKKYKDYMQTDFDIYNNYKDYTMIVPWHNIKWSNKNINKILKEDCSWWIENFYDSEHGIGFCSWQEFNFVGNWHTTQEQVQRELKYFLKKEIKGIKNKSCRLWECIFYDKFDDRYYRMIYVFNRDNEYKEDVIIAWDITYKYKCKCL